MLKNLMFNCWDEAGKFCLVVDLWPLPLPSLSLKKKGFRDHSRKIEILLAYVYKNGGIIDTEISIDNLKEVLLGVKKKPY